MMGSLKEMQAKVQEAQESLALIKVEAEAGGGMVKATVNGKKEVIAVDIDPDLLAKDEKEMVQDLVVAAINLALQRADEQAREEMKKTTSGMLPNIPGLNLDGLV